jgi:hypothetical protein
MAALTVESHWRVDLPELSALTIRFREDEPSRELLGIGDTSFSIVAGEAQPPGAKHGLGGSGRQRQQLDLRS